MIDLSSAREKSRLIQEQEELNEEMEARAACASASYWLQNCTMTKDSQDKANPTKPFPRDPYVKLVIDFMEWCQGTVFLYKSRTTMGTWMGAGVFAHEIFTNPKTSGCIISYDIGKSMDALEYVKELWRNSTGALKKRWRLAKDIDSQGEDVLELANGSSIVALPKGASKPRGRHDTIALWDEMTVCEGQEDLLSNIMHAKVKKIIGIATALPGPIDNRWKEAVPVDWPIHLLLSTKEDMHRAVEKASEKQAEVMLELLENQAMAGDAEEEGQNTQTAENPKRKTAVKRPRKKRKPGVNLHQMTKSEKKDLISRKLDDLRRKGKK